MTHYNDDQLILYHYREIDSAEAVAEHLDACEECRLRYDSLTQFLAAVDTAPVPERPDEYGQSVWQRIRPALTESTERSDTQHINNHAPLAPEGRGAGGEGRTPRTPQRRWAWAAGIAAAILIAFSLGRYWPLPDFQTAGKAPNGNVRERILLVNVGEHLERSQMMLVELVNTEGDSTVDISSEQQRAQSLVDDNRLFRQTAAREGDQATAAILDQLERVLLEIANAPSDLKSNEFESIRRDIEDGNILFKVRVVGENVRARSMGAVRDTLSGAI